MACQRRCWMPSARSVHSDGLNAWQQLIRCAMVVVKTSLPQGMAAPLPVSVGGCAAVAIAPGFCLVRIGVDGADADQHQAGGIMQAHSDLKGRSDETGSSSAIDSMEETGQGDQESEWHH